MATLNRKSSSCLIPRHTNPKRIFFCFFARYFTSNRLSTFRRQLSWYSFKHVRSGPDKGSYYHEHFCRGCPSLLLLLRRRKENFSQQRHHCSAEPPELNAHTMESQNIEAGEPVGQENFSGQLWGLLKDIIEEKASPAIETGCDEEITTIGANKPLGVEPFHPSSTPTLATQQSFCSESFPTPSFTNAPVANVSTDARLVASHSSSHIECCTAISQNTVNNKGSNGTSSQEQLQPYRKFSFDGLPVRVIGELDVLTGYFRLEAKH